MWIDPFWIGFLLGVPIGAAFLITLITVVASRRKGSKRG